MIILKIILIVIVCRMIGESLSQDKIKECEENMIQFEKDKEKIQDAHDMMKRESRRLVNTIKELRNELTTAHFKLAKVRSTKNDIRR